MGLLDPGALGRSNLGTVIVESPALDRTLAHAAGDSFKHIAYSHTPSEDRAPRRDNRTARDDISMMIRGRTNEWSVTTNFLPRGTNVPPDAAPFWRGLLGTETVGGASVTYSYARVPPSLGMIMTAGEPTAMAQEKLVGMLVNEGVITLATGNEPTAQFSGMSAESIRALGEMTIGAGANNATQAVGANEGARVKIGSIVEVVGIQTNLRVTARATNLGTVTFNSSINTGGGGQIVRPYTPWDDSTTNQGGEPIFGWRGSISIGGVTSHIITGATINVRNFWQPVTSQFSQTYVNAYVGHREVTGTMRFHAQADDILLLAEAEEYPASTPGSVNPVAVVLTLGDSTNGQCVITMPQVVLQFGQISFPEGDLATFELPFHCLSTRSSGTPQNDAITAVWS